MQGQDVAGLRKILLVEDDMLISEMYRLFLLEKGYEVVTAMDGEEGLQKAKEFHPDLIFLDIMMPKKNGLEVLRILRSDPSYGCQNCRIVILTNLGDDQIEASVHDLLDGYAVKAEITLANLIDIINSFQSAGTTHHA